MYTHIKKKEKETMNAASSVVINPSLWKTGPERSDQIEL